MARRRRPKGCCGVCAAGSCLAEGGVAGAGRFGGVGRCGMVMTRPVRVVGVDQAIKGL